MGNPDLSTRKVRVRGREMGHFLQNNLLRLARHYSEECGPWGKHWARSAPVFALQPRESTTVEVVIVAVC